MPVLHRLARRPPGFARVDGSRRFGRDLERTLQRSAVPVGRRPLHADDRYAARDHSLRRHSVVLHAIRSGRNHHRDRNAVDRFRTSPRAFSDSSRRLRPRRFGATRKPNPGKYCTRCAQGRWLASARFRSLVTTARSTAPPCSSFSRASTLSARTTGRPCRSCGRTSRQRFVGSTSTATRTATGSWNIRAAKQG